MSVKEMDQIEDMQAGEAILNAYMDTHISLFFDMLEPVYKESTI